MSTSQVPSSDAKRHRDNLALGIFLIVLAVLVCIESLRMPRFLGMGEVYSAPGVVPLLLAVLLGLMGVSLSIGAVRKGALQQVKGTWAELRTALGSEGMRRVVLSTALIAVYIFGLLRRIHYVLASALFLVGFMALFRTGNFRQRVLSPAVIALITSGVLYVAFTRMLLIPLP